MDKDLDLIVSDLMYHNEHMELIEAIEKAHIILNSVKGLHNDTY